LRNSRNGLVKLIPISDLFCVLPIGTSHAGHFHTARETITLARLKDTMPQIRCTLAQTQRRIDDALRIRFEVFARELGYLETSDRVVPRESDPFDTLDTTLHLVAYHGRTAAGAVRLLLPNTEIALANHTSFGLPIETHYDLSACERAGMRLAETTRFCVLSAYRGSAVAAFLHAACVRLSLRFGVTHWIAGANMETDALDDALIIQRALVARGFVRDDLRLVRHSALVPPLFPRRPFYDERARSRALAGDTSVPLPRTLDSYARRMHARFVGPPMFDLRFRMCALPFVAAVADQQPTHAHQALAA
jgi:L-ornithine Nalpha-acyltransferase